VRNHSTFHALFHPSDTEKQTHGCRHSNPDICGKNLMPNVCAFARGDGMCLAPKFLEKTVCKTEAQQDDVQVVSYQTLTPVIHKD